jgi:chemotaxis protein methyltransferase CheR
VTSAWEHLRRFVAEHTGLHFPPERQADLERGFTLAATEFGFKDLSPCIEWLLSAPTTEAIVRTLGKHLTVGETYFFRERKTFDALACVLMPIVDQRRREGERRLRLWSAACSTGEEAYSLAIFLQQHLPDFRDWDITILATDINEQALAKAAAGVYGEWSFREAAPGFKERYFRSTADARFAIAPAVKNLVTFAPFNLAQAPGWPRGQDVILCRNLLIYFTQEQARMLVARLRNALAEQGWLAVSPSECSQALFSEFTPVNFPGSILYRQSDASERCEAVTAGALESAAIVLASGMGKLSAPGSMARCLAAHAGADRVESAGAAGAGYAGATRGGTGRHFSESTRAGESHAGRGPLDLHATKARGDTASLSRRTRMLANQGDLGGALRCCERWIAADKIDARAHYLYAAILEAQGERAAARRSLLRTVYLEPEFVLAHVALGNLTSAEGRRGQAARHLKNALDLLAAHSPLELVPESEGMTVAQLVEIVRMLLHSPGQTLSEGVLE